LRENLNNKSYDLYGGIKMKANCYECKFRGNVAGDAHSCCNYSGNDTGILSFFEPKNFENMKKLNISGNKHGISHGWFMWPVNFDPVWLENCDGFEQKV
jgi:hypothetical protein